MPTTGFRQLTTATPPVSPPFQVPAPLRVPPRLKGSPVIPPTHLGVLLVIAQRTVFSIGARPERERNGSLQTPVAQLASRTPRRPRGRSAQIPECTPARPALQPDAPTQALALFRLLGRPVIRQIQPLTQRERRPVTHTGRLCGMEVGL